MPRANAMVPPDAIRIEDEVWEEAFARREPSRARRQRSLRAVEEPADWLEERSPEPMAATPRLSTVRSAPSESSTALPPPATAAGVIAGSTSSHATASELPAGRTSELPARRTSELPARRTVKIQGRGAERNLPWAEPTRRRPARRAYERSGFRPDRVAMWAVMLGFVLVLVAVASGHG